MARTIVTILFSLIFFCSTDCLHSSSPISYCGPILAPRRVFPYLYSGRPSPFNGPFASGAIGADINRWNEREVYLGTNPYPPIISVFTSGAAFEGELKVGLCKVFPSNGALTCSLGYHGYLNDKKRLLTVSAALPGNDEYITLRKNYGFFADLSPGIFFCRCWLFNAILGCECDQLRLIGTNGGGLFRDQERWGWSLRTGAGLRRAWGSRLAFGVDYVHLFPGNAVWQGPIQQFLNPDGTRRIVQVSSNQILFSLSYYFR